MLMTRTNWLKRGLSLLMAVIMVFGVNVTNAFAAESDGSETEKVVTINDENLRKALCIALNKEYFEGIEITETEMESLTEFVAENAGIVDITGLETAVNLEKLDLSGNLLDDKHRYTTRFTSEDNKDFLKDLEKLQTLTKLKELDLSNCNFGDNLDTQSGSLKAPGIPEGLQSLFYDLTSLEKIDLSDNGLTGELYLPAGSLGLKNLKEVDLSHNNICSLSGIVSQYLTVLEKVDLTGNYIFWDERDGTWHEAFLSGKVADVPHGEQSNLATLYAIGYGRGNSITSYSNFTIAEIDQETKTVDLGKIFSTDITIAPVGYASVNSSKATVNEQKATVVSLANVGAVSESQSQIVLENLTPGEYSYQMDVMHMGEDTETYTIKFQIASMPSDEGVDDSAGIKDMKIQYAVCKALGLENEVDTHVVTISEMESLTTLGASGVQDPSGVEYAVNLTSLTLRGSYDTLPDISKMTRLKQIWINAPIKEMPALTDLKSLTVVDLQLPEVEKVGKISNCTSLKTLRISADQNGNYPELSGLTAVTTIELRHGSKEVDIVGLEDCTKLTTISYYATGDVRFPTNVVTARGALNLTVNGETENEVTQLSLKGIENTNVSTLKLTLVNAAVTDIEDTAPLSTLTCVGNNLPDNIGQILSLKTLTIKGDCSELPSGIADSASIETVTVDTANVLPEEIGKIKSLKNLTIKICDNIPSGYDYSQSSLETLQISNSTGTEFPAADKLPITIKSIDLTSAPLVKISGTGYDKLTNLTTLKLGSCQLVEFPAVISEMTGLTTLVMGANFYGSIPKDAFDNLTSLKSVTLGSFIPVQEVGTYQWEVDKNYADTAAAIAKATEIATANGGSVVVEPFYFLMYGSGEYSALASLDSSEGMLDECIVTKKEVFAVVGEDVTNITLKPKAILEDTVITYNGQEYKSGEEIQIDNLKEGTNEIVLTCTNEFQNYLNTSKTVTYTVNIFRGSAIDANSFEEGHVYRVNITMYKSGKTEKSMSASYFDSYALVKKKDDKYEVRITTNRSSYISDMDYFDSEGNRIDGEVLAQDTSKDTATYRMYTGSLDEKMMISPYVVPMGYYPVCDVVFDLTGIMDVTDSMPSVDMTELNIAIYKALDIMNKNNVYTDKSYSDMTTALEAAQKIADDNTASQTDVDTAETVLTTAIKELVVDESKLANKTELETVIAEAKAIEKGNHTETAWNALQEAIADAQTVYDTLEASQSEVDSAKKSLSTAVTLFNNSGAASTLDKNNLEDGVYSVYVDMIKMDRESKSMADNAINHTVKLEVIDGEYYITLDFKGITIENRFGYLKNLSYYTDGYVYGEYGTVTGTLVAATILSTQKDSDGNDVIDQYNNADTLYPDIVTIKLVPQAIADEDGYVPLHVFVPIMEAIAEGNGDQDVLMKIDWSTLKATTADDEAFQPEEPVEQSPAVDVTDEKSGVKVHADKGVFEEGVKLIVTEITSGTEYDKAVSALEDVGRKFKLYEIHFEDANGNEVQPNGTVTVYYPIQEGYDAGNLVLYRINDDGSKTLIKGVVEGDYYKVVTKSFGNYALVEKGSTITDTENTANVNNAMTQSPQTGDDFNLMTWLAIILISAGMLAVGIINKRKVVKGE